jgi:dihydrofolate synthase/folylpolyglutamate synthase
LTYSQAEEYIWSSTDGKDSRGDLEGFRLLLEKLGNPQKRLKYAHVAGTNGKGSTCAFIFGIMRAAGYHVGLYTSPHLVRTNERIRFDDMDISDADFARLTTKVRDALEVLGQSLPIFMLLTAVAFLYFSERKPKIVILEVGLGGRLDATNIIDLAEVTVITRIGLDHTELLGNTLAEIAREKAGIIKPGSVVVLTRQEPEVEAVIIETAQRVGAFVRKAKSPSPMPQLGLKGMYQGENAATAIEAGYVLHERGFQVSEIDILNGLYNARWPGRFEVLQMSPYVILDGAHNQNGVEALAKSLTSVFGDKKIHFIFNARKDKDHTAMLDVIRPIAASISIDVPASTALAEIMPTLAPDDVLCVLGTLYQIGEVHQFFDDRGGQNV